MRKHNNVMNKRKSIEKRIESLPAEFCKEHSDLLEDCLLIEYASNSVKEVCKKVLNRAEFKQAGKVGKEKFQALIPIERKAMGISLKLLGLSKYRFGFMGGAMGETFTIYAESHTEAWKKASEHAIVEMGGIVRAVYCLELDDKDTGVLYNMKAMFEPKEKGVVNSVKADDLVPDWNKYNERI